LFRNKNYRNIGNWKRTVHWNTLSHKRQSANDCMGVLQGEGSNRKGSSSEC